MHVESILVRGDGAALGPRLASVASGTALNVLVLMSLGADHAALLSAVSDCGIKCPIFLTETYGIIGFDEELSRNVELMEKGRGSEYGFRGGSGGQGCLIVAYSGGASAGHTASFPRPEDVSSLMVVADTSKAFAKVAGDAPLHYGGITKEAFVLTEGGALKTLSGHRYQTHWKAQGLLPETPLIPVNVTTEAKLTRRTDMQPSTHPHTSGNAKTPRLPALRP